MAIKATCPKNPEHKQFITTAHVVETWVVEADGTFIESIESVEVTHKPDPRNLWTCATCEADAKVEVL